MQVIRFHSFPMQWVIITYISGVITFGFTSYYSGLDNRAKLLFTACLIIWPFMFLAPLDFMSQSLQIS